MANKRRIYNQKIGNFSCDISIDDCIATVNNVNGDVSSKEKVKRIACMVKSWCDYNKYDVTRVSINY